MTKIFEFSMNFLYLTIATSLFYFSLTYVGSYTNITSIDLIVIISLIILVSIIQYYIIKKHIFIILNERADLYIISIF